MFKYVITLLLLSAFAVQTFNRAGIVFDYYSNMASFAKNCENKARPALKCQGKCQMMKKLQEEEKKDQANQERRSENKNEVLLSSRSFHGSLYPPLSTALLSVKNAIPYNYHVKEIVIDILHPPQLL